MDKHRRHSPDIKLLTIAVFDDANPGEVM